MINNFIRRLVGVMLLTTFFAPTFAQAAEPADVDTNASDILIHKPSMFKFGIERINLSSNESMGMLGTSYLIEAMPNLYFGPAAYGAITGRRGGFFTAGGEVAWHQNLASRLELQTGVFVGGGGGSSASMSV